MTENGKTTVDIAAICGDKRGFAASKLVADHVHSTMGLPLTDASTKVYYAIGNNVSEWWNTPASMEYNAETKDVNGGFRTKLGYAFSGKTEAMVAAARGTGGKHESAGGTTAPKTPRKAKHQVRFDLEAGTVEFMLGAGVLVYNFPENRFSVGDLVTIGLHTNMIYQFCSNPVGFADGATEIDDDGNPILNSWKMGGYTSTKDSIEAAKEDIMTQAFEAKKFSILEALDKDTPVRQGAGNKAAFVAKWMPKPVVKEEKVPDAPKEEPSKLDVRLVDEGTR